MIGKIVVRTLCQRKDATKRLSGFVARASSNAAPQVNVPPSEEARKPLPYFRTSQNSPTEHSSKHIGKYYKLDADTKKKLFLYGGIHKEHEAMCKTFNETCLMVREPAIELMELMKSTNFNNPIVRYCLYGPFGSGKSATLAHLLHYGSENNFVLVHIPWAPLWYKTPKEFSDCPTKEGFVDVPLDAAAWLLHFKNQNAKLLANPELTVCQDWEWSKREITKKGSPLSQIIDMGINRVKYATACIEALLQELKQLSELKKCKTLVVIDGFNVFFSDTTRIKTAAFEKIPPQRVTITSPFVNMTNLDWNNGAVIVTADDRAFFRHKQKNTDLPYGVMGNECFAHLDPFIPIEAKRYTEAEFNSCIDYYVDRKWITKPYASTEEGRKEIAFLSNMNPYEVMRVCSPL